ncbi:hypothetical protein PFLUV_G00134020 [Perca fluviatilis]|uniref:Uncharacterized protein n=1 Tax=Perca fluviatilis TaxID=8168 RepID=A0A6A5ENA7_PERFL|nr:hypothetical protein PFLUV_G00134020 [Perca fluviatilis]
MVEQQEVSVSQRLAGELLLSQGNGGIHNTENNKQKCIYEQGNLSVCGLVSHQSAFKLIIKLQGEFLPQPYMAFLPASLVQA